MHEELEQAFGDLLGAMLIVNTTASAMAKNYANGVTVSRTTLAVLRDVARENGVQSLFKGVVPRVARVAPACAIVVSTYELLKAFLNRREIL